MAEFEIVDEIFEDAAEGFEDASEEAEEMSEEIQEEIAEARANVEELSQARSEFEILSKTVEALKSFGVFVVKNIAIGAILFGVNVGLSKLINIGKDQGQKESNRRKLAVVKAITDLIKTETDICKKVTDWLKEHKDDTIELEDITVPLESIFHTYLGPISDAVDQAFKAAQPLQTKINSKVSWEVPTAEDVGHLFEASEAFLTAFDNFRKFCVEHSSKFPVLKTLPLTQDDIDNIKSQLDAVKNMPFY